MAKNTVELNVEWTGKYPCLCHGEWRVTINGVDYSWAIPLDLRTSPMGTAGTYTSWHFEDWSEVFEDYEDGLDCAEWIAINPWVHILPCDPEDAFSAFQARDWRPGSCGGCI